MNPARHQLNSCGIILLVALQFHPDFIHALNPFPYFSIPQSEVEIMDKFQTIIYEKKDGVARITLNRPEAMNAINRTMFLEIGQRPR